MKQRQRLLRNYLIKRVRKDNNCIKTSNRENNNNFIFCINNETNNLSYLNEDYPEEYSTNKNVLFKSKNGNIMNDFANRRNTINYNHNTSPFIYKQKRNSSELSYEDIKNNHNNHYYNSFLGNNDVIKNYNDIIKKSKTNFYIKSEKNTIIKNRKIKNNLENEKLQINNPNNINLLLNNNSNYDYKNISNKDYIERIDNINKNKIINKNSYTNNSYNQYFFENNDEHNITNIQNNNKAYRINNIKENKKEKYSETLKRREENRKNFVKKNLKYMLINNFNNNNYYPISKNVNNEKIIIKNVNQFIQGERKERIFKRIYEKKNLLNYYEKKSLKEPKSVRNRLQNLDYNTLNNENIHLLYNENDFLALKLNADEKSYSKKVNNDKYIHEKKNNKYLGKNRNYEENISINNCSNVIERENFNEKKNIKNCKGINNKLNENLSIFLEDKIKKFPSYTEINYNKLKNIKIENNYNIKKVCKKKDIKFEICNVSNINIMGSNNKLSNNSNNSGNLIIIFNNNEKNKSHNIQINSKIDKNDIKKKVNNKDIKFINKLNIDAIEKFKDKLNLKVYDYKNGIKNNGIVTFGVFQKYYTFLQIYM